MAEAGKERKTIAFLRFKNKSRFRRLEFLEQGFPRMLADDLKLFSGALVLERSHIEKILDEVKLSEFGLVEDTTVQKALGADFIISGSFEEKIVDGVPVEDFDLEITIDIRNVLKDKIIGTINFSSKTKELDRLVSEVVLKIAKDLEIPLLIDRAIPDTEKKRLLEAAIHYEKGLQILGIESLEQRLGPFRTELGSKDTCKKALNEFLKSMYLNPRASAELRYVIAVCYKITGERARAEHEFRQVIESFPDSIWTGESLWELSELSGWHKDIHHLEKLVEVYPKHDRTCLAYKYIGRHHRDNSDYARAVGSYLNFLKAFPARWVDSGDRTDVLIDLADCYLNLNKSQAAVRILEYYTNQHSGQAKSRLHAKLGDIFYNLHQNDERTISEYQQAAKSYPNYETYIQLADAYFSFGKWEEAREVYNQSVGFLSSEIWDQKKLIYSYLQKGLVSRHLEEWEEALNYYKMIADKYDVAEEIQICYEKLGINFLPLKIEDIQETRYTYEDGIAGRHVTAMAVDKQGVWIATDDDGYHHLAYHHNKLKARVFINYYNKSMRIWKQFEHEDDIFAFPVTCIAIDQNVVWFGTAGGGVVMYNKGTEEWRNYTVEDGLLGDIVYAIEVDDNHVWVAGAAFRTKHKGFLDGWLSRMDKADEKWSVFIPPDVKCLSSIERAPALITMKNDGDYLWIGTAKLPAIFRFHKINGEWEELSSDAYADWSGHFTSNDYSISSIKVENDYVWLGTEWRGLKRYDKLNNVWESFFTSYTASYFHPYHRTENIAGNSELPDNRIYGIASDNNYVYIAAGGGLVAYSRDDGGWYKIKAIPYDTNFNSGGTRTGGDSIINIVLDDDSIWCRTISRGIIRYKRLGKAQKN